VERLFQPRRIPLEKEYFQGSGSPTVVVEGELWVSWPFGWIVWILVRIGAVQLENVISMMAMTEERGELASDASDLPDEIEY
jgi:hypothetical protein